MNPYSQLAQIIDNRINQLSTRPPVLDFGTIQPDMSLVTDQFPEAVYDYVICRGINHTHDIDYKCERNVYVLNEDGEIVLGSYVDCQECNCSFKRKDQIKPGDRVLVAWIGQELAILDIVVKPDFSE